MDFVLSVGFYMYVSLFLIINSCGWIRLYLLRRATIVWSRETWSRKIALMYKSGFMHYSFSNQTTRSTARFPPFFFPKNDGLCQAYISLSKEKGTLSHFLIRLIRRLIPGNYSAWFFKWLKNYYCLLIALLFSNLINIRYVYLSNDTAILSYV